MQPDRLVDLFPRDEWSVYMHQRDSDGTLGRTPTSDEYMVYIHHSVRDKIESENSGRDECTMHIHH